MFILKADGVAQERTLAEMPKASDGYGGKFGVQTDRVDKSALGWEEKSAVAPHESQTGNFFTFYTLPHGYGFLNGWNGDKIWVSLSPDHFGGLFVFVLVID